jgi:PKD repeat protein
MIKHKWHSRLVNLAVAFALVFSLVGIAVMPVTAQADPELTVTVTTPEDTYCCCDTFNVTATIENTGAVNATNVVGSIAIVGHAEVTGGPSPAFGFNITPGNTKEVVWEVHCDGIDVVKPTKITVKVEADNADQVSDYTEVTQESGALQAFVVEPLGTDRIPACRCFNLTFYVRNNGCNPVSSVFALVWTVGEAEIGCPPGPTYDRLTTDFLEPEVLEPGAVSENYTLTLHCTDAGRAGVHVKPYGNDSCYYVNGQPYELEGTSAIVEWDQVFGLTCDAEPNPTKFCHDVTFTTTIGTGAQYPASWVWNFDDGKSASGTIGDTENPFSVEHHYNVTGNHTACVNVTDDSGTTVQCCTEVTVYPKLEVSCNATPNPTKEDHDVEFSATRVGGIPPGPDCSYSWFWDFGDGTNSTAQNPIHAYGTAGTYQAEVTLTDDCGIDPANVATCNRTIIVKPALNVTCEADPLETKVGHNITFTGNITGGVGPYDWTWTYGDLGSDSGILLDPGPVVKEHNYLVEGDYVACFYVIDSLGNEEECCVPVKVHPPLKVSCNATPEVSPVCHNVTFSARRKGGVPGDEYSWLWDFGDGTFSTAQNVTRAYMCVGNYSATVTLTDLDLGNTANCTANVTVTIFPPELYEPGNGVTLPSGEEVCFEWEDIGCCNYTLQVWQKEADGQKVWLVETGKDNTWCGPIMDGNYRWWVTATDMCGKNATSEVRYFGVQESNIAVHVTHPDGGEEFVGGGTETITWDAAYVDRYMAGFGGSQLDLSIAISYSSDSGATWTEAASGEENDGVYAWSVPPVNSDQCLVKVVATDDFTNLGVDTSDSVFTITTGVLVSIPDAAVSAGGSVIVPININGVTDLAAVEIWLTYDKTVVEVDAVTAGDLGALTSFSIDNVNGVTKMNRLSGTGQTGDFVFANVELEAVGSAGDTSDLDLDVKTLVDSDGVDITHGVEDGVFAIVDLMEGDANLDGCVSIVDALFIAQKSLGMRILNADQLICGDTFDDGAVDMLDALHIAQWRVDPDGSLGVLLMGPLWDAGHDAGITVEPIAC